MAFYGGEQWSAPGRTPSWEQPQQQNRGPAPQPAANAPTDEPNAFAGQLAEIDRAIDNLMKSGKFPMGMPGGPRGGAMPMAPGRPFVDFDPRMSSGPRHHQPQSDYDNMRPQHNTNMPHHYQQNRYNNGPAPHHQQSPYNPNQNGPRGQNEQAPQGQQQQQQQQQQQGQENPQQTRRRNAAQRERELRNYHQDQQYQKHLSGAKSDRSQSPIAAGAAAAGVGMSEEDRRGLIARQHKALYGEGSNMYTGANGAGARLASQEGRAVSGLRGGSPLAYGSSAASKLGDGGAPLPAEMKNVDARGSENPSPLAGQSQSFASFGTAQQSSRTSTASPNNTSPPRNGTQQSSTAPIGTRSVSGGQQSNVTSLQKRSTTPLPSPLSYGFSANDRPSTERTTSASSNPSSAQDNGVSLGWPAQSGGNVWGSSKGGLGGVQASVWS